MAECAQRTPARLRPVSFVPLRQTFDEPGDPFGAGRTGQYRIDRHAGSGRHFGQSAGNGKLGRLRHAVVDHLDRDVDGRLAGDEHYPTPVPVEHPRQIGPASRTPLMTFVCKKRSHSASEMSKKGFAA